jgi:dephospho-CoA kinase
MGLAGLHFKKTNWRHKDLRMGNILGVTGGMGCGKTYFCQQIRIALLQKGIVTSIVEVDRIRAQLLGRNAFVKLHVRLAEIFGPKVLRRGGGIDRQQLAAEMSQSDEARNSGEGCINEVLRPCVFKECLQKPSLVLVEDALLVERGLLELVSFQTVAIFCSLERQLSRLQRGDLAPWIVQARMRAQGSHAARIQKISQCVTTSGRGFLRIFDTEQNPSFAEYQTMASEIFQRMEVQI